MVTVIDGRNLIHGRLASVVAERIMDGEEIVVLNAEAIVITGVKEQVFADFKAKVDRGDTTKRKGPFYPRRADLLFKRCVRGMIPWTMREHKRKEEDRHRQSHRQRGLRQGDHQQDPHRGLHTRAG